jgi:hypothetical protein
MTQFADLGGDGRNGHEDAFPSPRLSDRCEFSQGTFPGTRGSGREAPIPALRGTEIERQGFEPKPSLLATGPRLGSAQGPRGFHALEGADYHSYRIMTAGCDQAALSVRARRRFAIR